ncbi:hypothetical protein KCU65_g5010, partial [Aureobasidium melanogenum]
MADTVGGSGSELQDGVHADVPSPSNIDNSQISISTQIDEELMELSNLCLSSSQSNAPDLNKSVLTDQEQLESICTQSDEVFSSMDKLGRDLLTWQELQINQDSIASMLHQNSPDNLHENDITTIPGAELECLDLELEYQVNMLIPSPFLMARQVYDALNGHKSVIQGIISDMRHLELKFPQEEELMDRRSEHEADVKMVEDWLDNILRTVEAISVRPA